MRKATSLGSPIAAVVCTVALAACGSASKQSAKSAARPSTGFLAFSICMRSHGVPNFPDPSPGGGIKIPANSGLNPFSPSFKAAQAQCHKLLPGGGPPSGPPSAQDKAAMLQISECMRSHGISGFPDPTFTPPSSPAGYSEVMDRDGVVLAIPSTIDTASPAYKQAAAACHFGP
jgi:hypothetical protein